MHHSVAKQLTEDWRDCDLPQHLANGSLSLQQA